MLLNMREIKIFFWYLKIFFLYEEISFTMKKVHLRLVLNISQIIVSPLH